MAHTRTWDAAYEANPANTQNINQGATRIREVKLDVRERLALDHSMAGDDNDGLHNKVTLLEQASAPTAAAGQGILYTRDVSGATALFFKGDDDVEHSVDFPSGTRMAFAQAAAPTGWTQYNSITNYMMRVVNNTVSGSYATSWEVNGRGGSDSPILNNKVPSHTHTFTTGSSGAHTHFATGLDNLVGTGGGFNWGGPGGDLRETSISGAHTHSGTTAANGSASNWTPFYLDMILATKD